MFKLVAYKGPLILAALAFKVPVVQICELPTVVVTFANPLKYPPLITALPVLKFVVCVVVAVKLDKPFI